jgi:SAM-dependent methyltransferase
MSSEPAVVDRLERERVFHDERFGDEEPEERDRFYAYVDGARERLRAATSRFRPGDRVLEIGIGVASTGWSLAERGVEVVAIDISPVAVERGRAAAAAAGLTTIEFQEMNAEQLDFTAGSFDGVIGSGILHHLELSSALDEVRRVLRADGRGIFYEPLGHNPFINWYRNRTPSMRTDDEHPLIRADFALARRSFGRVESSFHHCAVIGCALLPRRVAILARPLLNLVDGVLLRFPGVRWLGWITVMELSKPR